MDDANFHIRINPGGMCHDPIPTRFDFSLGVDGQPSAIALSL
jgi:hypothetical protein